VRKMDPSPNRDKPSPDTSVGAPLRARRSTTFFLSFIIFFVLWLIFSGRFDAFHITLGLISSAIVSFLSGDLLFLSSRPKGMLRMWVRLVGYIPWLLYQVFLANLQVMYLTFHPRLIEKIDPQIIEFESRLKSDYSRTTFANSITLTPGTITVNVTVLGKFAVHCINTKAGEPLPGETEERIAKVFSE